ncbi:MAG: hypothetical protein ACJAQ6_001550 [Arenicella sp.]
MSLKNLLKMQLLWVAFGLAYNLASAWRIQSVGVALSPTDPVAGAVFVGICGLIIFVGFNRAPWLYKFAAPCLALLLIYSGIGLHVIAFLTDAGLSGYASFTSWLVAVLINSYGASVLLLGSCFAWRSRDI